MPTKPARFTDGLSNDLCLLRMKLQAAFRKALSICKYHVRVLSVTLLAPSPACPAGAKVWLARGSATSPPRPGRVPPAAATASANAGVTTIGALAFRLWLLPGKPARGPRNDAMVIPFCHSRQDARTRSYCQLAMPYVCRPFGPGLCRGTSPVAAPPAEVVAALRAEGLEGLGIDRTNVTSSSLSQGRRPDAVVLRSSAGIAAILRIPVCVRVLARRRPTRVQ